MFYERNYKSRRNLFYIFLPFKTDYSKTSYKLVSLYIFFLSVVTEIILKPLDILCCNNTQQSISKNNNVLLAVLWRSKIDPNKILHCLGRKQIPLACYIKNFSLLNVPLNQPLPASFVTLNGLCFNFLRLCGKY